MGTDASIPLGLEIARTIDCWLGRFPLSRPVPSKPDNGPDLMSLSTDETVTPRSSRRRPVGRWLDFLDAVRRGTSPLGSRLGPTGPVRLFSRLSAGLGLWRPPRLRLRPGAGLRWARIW